ncbi:MAG TPA: hypothetical protein VGP37_06280 [Candidatus Nanopelagicales bacterium]|nr:hypothetical protein [Candidatus Nanopelagicales bacterium]
MHTRPWQLVALATMCFITAFHLLTGVLEEVLAQSSFANVEALAAQGFMGGDTNSLSEHLALSADIFGIMTVIVFMFGFLLYRGQYLAGVRLTGTIFFAIGFAGYVLQGGSSDDGTALSTTSDRFITIGLIGIVLAGFISLFFGRSAAWVATHKEG